MDASRTRSRAAAVDLKDLPLIEVVAKEPSHTMAVFLSGDGGWAAIDKAIAGALQKHGVSVVGISSLKYFWRTRTPEGGASDLARITKVYRERWKADTIIVIGFSRGAGVMPFMLNRLADSERGFVKLMALVGAEHTAGFKFHPLDLLGLGSTKGDPPVMPEIEKITAIPIICFYGEKEDDTLCPELREPNIAVKMTGGHHMDGNYGAIGDRIFAAIDSIGHRP